MRFFPREKVKVKLKQQKAKPAGQPTKRRTNVSGMRKPEPHSGRDTRPPLSLWLLQVERVSLALVLGFCFSLAQLLITFIYSHNVSWLHKL